MTVKDLTIGSPVYRVQLDSIDVARVRLIEGFEDGTRRIELNQYGHNCVEKTDVSEINTMNRHGFDKTRWYLNIEDAKLVQLVQRSEYVELKKETMEKAQNEYADAVKRYAFAEPSISKEL